MDPRPSLHDVLPLDPGDVVGELVGPPVLPLGPPVARVSGKPRIARPGKRRQARDGRVLIRLKSSDPGLLIEVRALPLEIRVGPVLAIEEADARFVNHVRAKIAG